MHYVESDMCWNKLVIIELGNESKLNMIPFQEACCCHCPAHNPDIAAETRARENLEL